MHFLFAIILAVSLSMTGANAQDAKQDEHPDPEPKTFKEAYAGYNEAVKSSDAHLTTHYAEHAYKLGLKKFGKEDSNTLNLALNWMKSHPTAWSKIEPFDAIISDIFPYFEKSPKTDPATLIDIYLTSANYLIHITQLKSKKKAISLSRKAIKIVDRNFKENASAIAIVNLQVGEMLYSQGSKDAKKYFLKALKLYSLEPEKNEFQIAISNFWVAKSLLASKSYTKATKTMSLALKTFDEVAPASHFALTGHAFMIQILEKQGLREEATKHCQLIGKAQPMDVNQEQKPLYRFVPDYPRTRKTGSVILEFTVDEKGYVKNPKAIDGENMDLFAEAAKKAAVKYRYAPRYENGKPVSTDGLKTRFTFKSSIRR